MSTRVTRYMFFFFWRPLAYFLCIKLLWNTVVFVEITETTTTNGDMGSRIHRQTERPKGRRTDTRTLQSIEYLLHYYDGLSWVFIFVPSNRQNRLICVTQQPTVPQI